MAEEDRKVEARPAVSGSGMLTDPERIRKLEAERARRERAWREAPERSFGEVLQDRPVADEELTDDAEDDTTVTATEVEASDDNDADGNNALPKRPVDPRAAALHSGWETSATPNVKRSTSSAKKIKSSHRTPRKKK